MNLLQADLVIADLSSGNLNAFYELGIRHALRPHATIVISENKLPYPFDLNHIKITSYEHLGGIIDIAEGARFQMELSKTIDKYLSKKKPDCDSPVYHYINNLLPPTINLQLSTKVKPLQLS